MIFLKRGLTAILFVVALASCAPSGSQQSAPATTSRDALDAVPQLSGGFTGFNDHLVSGNAVLATGSDGRQLLVFDQAFRFDGSPKPGIVLIYASGFELRLAPLQSNSGRQVYLLPIIGGSETGSVKSVKIEDWQFDVLLALAELEEVS
ncbi:MAG: hypothetical protein AAGC81_10140 [Pseudomonadota bacterium]